MTEAHVESYSFWDRLGKERPVVLYGTGNGADKIIDVLEQRNVRPDAIFASDGFVRDRTFRGIKVSSYRETVEKLGCDISVLLSFGTDRPEVLNFITELDAKHDLIIPEVPLYGGDLFDADYFNRNRQRILSTAELFDDDRSKRLFFDAVNFRLTGKLRYLTLCEPFDRSVKDLLSSRNISVIVDGGAYKGDTSRLFLEIFPDTELLYAAEPDPLSFLKLKENETDSRIRPLNAALSSCCGFSPFSSSSSRGSGVTGKAKRSKNVSVETVTIDSLLNGNKCDLIKLDVEGDEREALNGAKETIKEFAPSLVISLYHRTDDLFDIPRAVIEYNEDYSLYLRRPYCVPMWDLNLFAVKKGRE